MKVVHHFVRVSERSGGVSRAVFDLVSILAAAGHEVTLLTSADSDFPQGWRAEGRGQPKFVPLAPPYGPIQLFPRAGLEQAASVLKCADLLHLHGMWRPSNYQIVGVTRRLGKPYVMTSHGTLDDWCMRQRPLRKRVYHWLVERRNLDAARRVHATAQAEAEQSRKWIPHERIAVVPCAVDLAPFAEPPEPEIFLARHPEVDAGRPCVLFLSRLHPKKGVDILIEAIGLLRQRNVDCQLLIAGSGDASYSRHLRRLSEKRVPDAHFLGLVTGAQKLALYRFADLLALPTSQENFGLVIPEALALETPVVTTRGTDIWPELEASGASVIVEKTAEAFAGAIGDLLADEPLRRRMGRVGRRWVFDWLEPRRIAAQYEQLYRAALSE